MLLFHDYAVVLIIFNCAIKPAILFDSIFNVVIYLANKRRAFVSIRSSLSLNDNLNTFLLQELLCPINHTS